MYLLIVLGFLATSRNPFIPVETTAEKCAINPKSYNITHAYGFRLIFLWNEVPGKDKRRPVETSTRGVQIESIDRHDIEKQDTDEYSKITVHTSTSLTVLPP
jgi:hypothetical protein